MTPEEITAMIEHMRERGYSEEDIVIAVALETDPDFKGDVIDEDGTGEDE